MTAQENVLTRHAKGRVLAADVLATTPLPPFDQSAMDGYALCHADLLGVPPWTLRVAGETAAGAPAVRLEPGTACRIFTGAPMPRGADTVVMQEHVERQGEAIRIPRHMAAGTHVRARGADLSQEAVALRKGARVGAGHIALGHMVDAKYLLVHARPRVAFVCTGAELRPVGEGVFGGADGLIPESNSAALAVLAEQAGAEVRVIAVVGDDLEKTEQALREGLVGADVLVTVGGVSVGDYDFVRPAMERVGIALDFWKVAIRPGKPLAVGHTDRAHVLGLPGNPASALVTFALFGMPLLRAMQGDSSPNPLPLPATLTAPVKPSSDRLQVLRGTLSREGGGLTVTPHGNQSSGAATSLADSDVLVFVPPHEEVTRTGTPVSVVPWSAL